MNLDQGINIIEFMKKQDALYFTFQNIIHEQIKKKINVDYA